MIQRIQSVFYLLAALCAGALFLIPIASSNNTNAMFFEDKLFNVQDHIGLLIITGMAVLLPLTVIFLFKNRPLQLKLGYGSLLLPLFLLTIIAYVYFSKADSSTVISANAGMFLPLGVILFLVLGNNFVKKDEELVKSSERLR